MASLASNKEHQSIRAKLIPKVESLSKSRGPPLLQSTNPIVTTALSKAFPIIIFLDSILAVLTWTNEDRYFNTLIICAYILIVRYWSWMSVIVFPSLICFMFCCFIWSYKTIRDDVDSTENNPPTLEEICDTLSNMTTRMELLLQPLWVIKEMKSSEGLKIVISSILLSPIYIATMKLIFSCKLFVMAWGCICLSYNSEQFKGFRKLLWRSVYSRKLFMLVTGIDINTKTNEDYSSTGQISLLTDFEILSITNNPKGKGTIIEFTIYENERRWFGLGWCKYFFPYERGAFTNSKLEECCSSLQDFEFPAINNEKSPSPENKQSFRWKWLAEEWKIDYGFCKDKKDTDGWVFYNNNWEDPDYCDSFSRLTRTRKWKRLALVIVES